MHDEVQISAQTVEYTRKEQLKNLIKLGYHLRECHLRLIT